MKNLIKLFLGLIVTATIVSSCTTPYGMYRGAGESKECHQWRAYHQTCGPIH